METLKVQTINFSPKKQIQPQKDLTKFQNERDQKKNLKKSFNK